LAIFRNRRRGDWRARLRSAMQIQLDRYEQINCCCAIQNFLHEIHSKKLLCLCTSSSYILPVHSILAVPLHFFFKRQ
jgi:nitroreductase